MKAYVYLAAGFSVAGCAFGVGVEPQEDAGIIHADSGGVKDAKATQDVATQDVSQQLPDVSQPQTCSPLPLPTGIPACDTCIGNSCCNEDTACGTDANCMNFINCESGCSLTDAGVPDPNCLSACQASYPTGANELSALDNCLSVQCRTQCFGP